MERCLERRVSVSRCASPFHDPGPLSLSLSLSSSFPSPPLRTSGQLQSFHSSPTCDTTQTDETAGQSGQRKQNETRRPPRPYQCWCVAHWPRWDVGHFPWPLQDGPGSANRWSHSAGPQGRWKGCTFPHPPITTLHPDLLEAESFSVEETVLGLCVPSHAPCLWTKPLVQGWPVTPHSRLGSKAVSSEHSFWLPRAPNLVVFKCVMDATRFGQSTTRGDSKR